MQFSARIVLRCALAAVGFAGVASTLSELVSQAGVSQSVDHLLRSAGSENQVDDASRAREELRRRLAQLNRDAQLQMRSFDEASAGLRQEQQVYVPKSKVYSEPDSRTQRGSTVAASAHLERKLGETDELAHLRKQLALAEQTEQKLQVRLRDEEKAKLEAAKAAEAQVEEETRLTGTLAAQMHALEAKASEQMAMMKAEAAKIAAGKTEDGSGENAMKQEIHRLTSARDQLRKEVQGLKHAKSKERHPVSSLQTPVSREASVRALQVENKRLSKLAAAEEGTLIGLRSKVSAAGSADKKLRMQLVALQEASARGRAEVEELESARDELRAQLQSSLAKQSELARRQRSLSMGQSKALGELQRQLREAKEANDKLKAKAVEASAVVDSKAKAAHSDHMQLLAMISDLQDQIQHEQQEEEKLKKTAKSARSDVEKELDVVRTQEAQAEKDHMRAIDALQTKLDAANTKISAYAAQASAASIEVDVLEKAVAKKEQQLQSAMSEVSDLRAARDSALHGRVAFQQVSSQAQVSVRQMQEQLSQAMQREKGAKAKAERAASEASRLRRERETMLAQLKTLQQSTSQNQLHANEKVHAMMLNAAAKVRSMEETVETLQSQVQKARVAYSQAAMEGAKAKDTLMQEADAALKASQRADGLMASLEAAKKAEQDSRDRATQLTSQVSALETAHSETDKKLEAIERRYADSESKAEQLEEAVQESKKKVRQLADENEKLNSQASDFSEDSQRADVLADQLNALRAEAKKNATREVEMLQQAQRLRELKDHYSEEYDSAQTDVGTLKAKAEELDQKLLESERRTADLSRERDDAVERLHTARSEQDEYFQENSNLNEQNQALQTKLRDAGDAINRTALEEQVLRGELQQVREDSVREQKASHAEWASNEHEAESLREDLREQSQEKDDMQAKLSKISAVLTEEQRKKLGLLTAPKAPPAQKDPPASVGAVQAVTSAAASLHRAAAAAAATPKRLAHAAQAPTAQLRGEPRARSLRPRRPVEKLAAALTMPVHH